MSETPTATDRRIHRGAIQRAKEARKTIGRERDYSCSQCEFERRSWLALRHCPSCGSGFAQAPIVRAALA